MCHVALFVRAGSRVGTLQHALGTLHRSRCNGIGTLSQDIVVAIRLAIRGSAPIPEVIERQATNAPANLYM